MTFIIAPIVEGHGDVAALPVLLRRIAPALQVKRPVRFPRSKLLSDEHLARAALIAAANIAENGAVLLVIDGDEDCAARMGLDLESRLQKVLPRRMSRVVIPVREFESWIVGGDSRSGAQDSDTAGNPKGRIRQWLGVYSETADQARLIASTDLGLLESRSRSFRRLLKVMAEFAKRADETSPKNGTQA